MKRLFGLCLLVLAGCAAQAGRSRTTDAASPAIRELPLPPKGALSARIGVELLAAMPAAEPYASSAPQGPEGRVTVEPANRSRPPEPVVPAAEERPSALPWLTEGELERIHDPVERFTLHFLNHLVGDDRRRPERRLGAPILFDQWRRASSEGSIETTLDARDREDYAMLLTREGRGMLGRPLRRALRDTELVRTLELELDSFKADHVPFSEAWDETHGGDRDLGHLSLRLRPSSARDPLEVAWDTGPVRIGTGTERLKVSYSVELTPGLRLSLRSHWLYDADQLELFGDLHWQITPVTSLHVLAGDRMDLLTGSRLYPVVQSPVVLRAVEESPGVLVYVEHVF